MYTHCDGPHWLNVFLITSDLYPVSAQKMSQREDPVTGQEGSISVCDGARMSQFSLQYYQATS